MSSNVPDEDLLRWERMYEGKNKSTKTSETDIASMAQSEVRVVSFDLDNTLWNTTATISAANDALASFLDKHEILQPKRVELVMGDLFKAS